MKTTAIYTLATGSADQKRLEIASRLYNPVTMDFLKKCGLKKDMAVLEVGCGSGIMACSLAEEVGTKGHVLAIDNSEEQLEIARQLAKSKNISNIDFQKMDVINLTSLNNQFDFVYGRWILEYVNPPEIGLIQMLAALKQGGILSYEGASIIENGHFSYPKLSVIQEWFNVSNEIYKILSLDNNLGLRLYDMFKNLGCQNIETITNQPILTTPEEKSLFRLSFINAREMILKTKVLSLTSLDDMLNELAIIEEQDCIIGFFRNILIKGEKADLLVD